MPFVKRGVYERLRFHSEATPQHYILADITSVCCCLLSNDFGNIFSNFETIEFIFVAVFMACVFCCL